MLEKIDRLLTVVGALVVKEIFDEYVRRHHEAGASESSLDTLKDMKDDFAEYVSTQTGKAMDRLHFVPREDLEKLEERLARIEQKLDQIISREP